MVRTAAIAIALLLATGCDKLVTNRNDDRTWDLMQESAKQNLEIIQLKSELARLKGDQERDRAFLVAVSNSLTEARENHARLRKTFNENVEIENRRHQAIEQRLTR